jgi:hypothetical protein
MKRKENRWKIKKMNENKLLCVRGVTQAQSHAIVPTCDVNHALRHMFLVVLFEFRLLKENTTS